MSASASSPFKRMKLRYAGTCRRCGTALPAGQVAVYVRAPKQLECLPCFQTAADGEPWPTSVDGQGAADSAEAIAATDQSPRTHHDPEVTAIETGVAGASARREHLRRVARREQRIRAAHPRLGGLILAVSDEPQSTRAWARGAAGEEKVARSLDALIQYGARVLHDRRIPHSKANIDHIVIGPAGIFVIDTKRYTGRPHLRVQGGLLRPRTQTLMVGHRDCSKLVTAMHKQVDLVRAALDHLHADALPVRGMLCFVDADWPLIGGSFTTDTIDVLWPNKIADRVLTPQTLTPDQIAATHTLLATHFPPA